MNLKISKIAGLLLIPNILLACGPSIEQMLWVGVPVGSLAVLGLYYIVSTVLAMIKEKKINYKKAIFLTVFIVVPIIVSIVDSLLSQEYFLMPIVVVSYLISILILGVMGLFRIGKMLIILGKKN